LEGNLAHNYSHSNKKVLLKVWRLLPVWIQLRLSRIIRPLFQVFAAAVIFDEDKNIFLVKSTYQRFHPWGLPGGSLEYGEHPEEAVIREVWEETGLNICIEKLLLVNSWLPDRVGLYYLCRITDGTFHPSDEVAEFDYFSLDNLPDVRSLDREMIKRLHQIVEHELA
jgi:ADP-ribose pyrophosphatase YjhB (NUDIX family)